MRAKWLGGVAALQYDPLRDATPSYLLVGRFGKYTGMYDSYVQASSRSCFGQLATTTCTA